MRNVEILRNYYLGRDPALKETLADNSLRLIGIRGEEFALKVDVKRLIDELEELMEESDLELANDIVELRDALNTHKNNNLIHVTPTQIAKINAAVTTSDLATALLQTLNQAKGYTDTEIDELKDYVDDIIISAGLSYEVVQTLPVSNIKPNCIYLLRKQSPIAGNAYDEYMYVNHNWEVFGSTDSDQVIEDIQTEPNKVINSDYFYRFKNLVDNSSFEVFNGQTGIPLGWTGCTVDLNASMFGTYSMKIAKGDTAVQTSDHLADVTWAQGAYDTEDFILSFYHKFGGCIVKVYDVTNAGYLDLVPLDGELQPVTDLVVQAIQYDYKANWNKYRNYIKFTPAQTTTTIRIEIQCPQSATREVYIDGISLEPYEEGEYPSIYKEGRYSISASQVMNPPPGDVDRFTHFEHFNIRNGVEDANGFLTYQELARADGTLAVKRQASNPDANGFYQTVVETFYKADGVTPEYVDTYTYTFSAAGAIKSRTRSTTEV